MKKLAPLILFILWSCSTLPPVDYSPGLQGLGPRDFPAAVKELHQSLLAIADTEARETFFQQWVASLPHSSLPLVKDGVATFVIWGPEMKRPPVVTGEFNNYSPDDRMFSLGRSGLWVRSISGLGEEDFLYSFLVETEQGVIRITDPLGREIFPSKPIQSRFRKNPENHGRMLETPRLRAPRPSSDRSLYVYLPPGYDHDLDQHYPVFYWMEAQHLWDHPSLLHGGYKLDTTLDRLILEGRIPPMIAVGVPHDRSIRGGEYMGFGAWYGLEMTPEQERLAENYRQLNDSFRGFMVEVVKPYIDNNFRTKTDPQNTAVGGGSFGGGISMSLNLLHPEVFGKSAAMAVGQYDPSMGQWRTNPFKLFPWLVNEASQALRENRPGIREVKMWIDCGTEGIDVVFLPKNEALVQGLLEAGLIKETNVLWRVYEGTGHHEGYWAERLDDVLLALFGGE